MRGLTDAELTIGLQNGKVEAFDELYWRYHNEVYFNVLKLVKDPTLADDVLQEVFITLWEKRQYLNNDKSIAGWLFTISFNKSIDVLRKSAKEAAVIKNLPVLLLGPDKEYKQLTELKYELLDKALGQLSTQKQKVFKLCKLEGKTYEEAAKEMQLSKQTVKKYLAEAVLSIKSYVRNHPDLAIAQLSLVWLFIDLV